MADYWIGFMAGCGVALLIATALSKWEHREWCRIVDRQYALLERMAQRMTRPDDPADWWKQS